MKRTRIQLALVAVALVAPGIATSQPSHAYVGVKACSLCHKTEKQGNQLAIWERSKHSQAYVTLTTDTANAIAKSRGITTPASEAKECLECHTITGGVGSADPKQGVQCESCHGAGADYKSMSVMKDRAAAVAAGLQVFSDRAAAESMCKKCHNEKSPTFKPFNYEERWAKIAHKKPA